MGKRLYIIADARIGRAVYVGLAKNPKARLTHHLRDRNALGEWLRTRRLTGNERNRLEADSKWVDVLLVDMGPSDREAERKAIIGLGKRGHPLLNRHHTTNLPHRTGLARASRLVGEILRM